MTATARPGRHRPGTIVAAMSALVVLAGCGTGAAAPAPDPARAASQPGRSAGALRELTSGPLMPSSPPVRVTIPRFKTTSGLIALGLLSDGSMQVPPNADVVGWFTGAPTPGSLGPAVLAGHEDWNGKEGAFAKIGRLVPGDEIVVNRLDGSTAVFAVTRVQEYPKNQFPTAAVYGPIDHAGLRLITCGGVFDSSTHHYRDNVIAFADLREAVPR
jgi:Sortase domain